MPLVSNSQLVPTGLNTDRWGYILIALAGAFLLFDRYFGFSTSWMRYMTAQMALQKALERFQLSWAVWRIAVKNQKPTDDQHNSGIALLNNFQQQTAELIEKEFQIWVTQFQEQLTALQAAIDKDRKERYPGNLVVTFHAQTAITGPADIYLNNRLAQQTDSGSMLFSALNPETHLVQVKANKGALQGSKTVKVESGQTSEVSIELKTVTPSTTIP